MPDEDNQRVTSRRRHDQPARQRFWREQIRHADRTSPLILTRGPVGG
jgi:hypothetical protein